MDEWIRDRRRLLALEQDEERRQLQEKLQQLTPQECQEEGISLLSVEMAESWTSLFGRVTLMVRRLDKAPLPTHSFRVGDEVRLYSPKQQHTESAEASSCSGVVSKVTQTSIEMVTNAADDLSLVFPLRLDMSVSEATNKKLSAALTEMEKPYDSPGWPVASIVFEKSPLLLPAEVHIAPINTGLNQSQVRAIDNVLGSPHLALIHGPPGTGKTTAVTEVILQSVLRRQKLLVCAPSNVATDNLLEKLADYANAPGAIVKPKMIRIGHPARINPTIQRYCLDAAIMTDEAQEIILDIRKEITGLRRSMVKGGGWEERRHMRSELKALSGEVRKREKRIVSEIIRTSDIILCTTIGASSSLLRNTTFDVCVIDEAAQAIDVSCWIPMLRSSKCIMAGDHCQLPPTIKSKAAEQGGLGNTLFHSLILRDVDKISTRMLDTQYRMNHLINDWASMEMYNGLLKSAPENEFHTLSGLGARVSTTELGDIGSCVLLLVDTTGCDMMESGGEEEGGSYRNEGEANLVLQHIQRLVEGGVAESEIGVITPYNAQVQLLKLLVRESSYPNVQVKTVDGFQGGEKEAIILSFVRSNDTRSVGFLADKRRINVAVTRARRHLAVICNAETCSSDAFLGRFIQYISEIGEHRSAAELTIEDTVALEYSGPVVSATGNIAVAECNNTMKQESQPAAPPDDGSSKKSKKKKTKHLDTLSGPPGITITAVSIGIKDTLPRAVSIEEKQCMSRSFKRLLDLFSAGDVIGGIVDVYSINESAYVEQPDNDIYEILAVKEWLSSLAEGGDIIVTNCGDHIADGKSLPLVFVVKTIFSNCLEFPVSLSSFHRLLIHEVCDTLSLNHKSMGDSSGRHIEVYKSPMRVPLQDKVESSNAVVVDGYDMLQAGENDDETPEQDLILKEEDSSVVQIERDSSSGKEVSTAHPKSSKKSKKAVKKAEVDEVDEMAFLDAEIAKNKEYAEYRKYRVSATAFPNPYKEDVRSKVVHTLSDAQNSRRAGSGSSGSLRATGIHHGGGTRMRTGTATATTTVPDEPVVQKPRRTKVLKKPPRQFGGGKLGTRDDS